MVTFEGTMSYYDDNTLHTTNSLLQQEPVQALPEFGSAYRLLAAESDRGAVLR